MLIHHAGGPDNRSSPERICPGEVAILITFERFWTFRKLEKPPMQSRLEDRRKIKKRLKKDNPCK